MARANPRVPALAAFGRSYKTRLPALAAFGTPIASVDLSDPARAQRNRLARDRLLRGDCIAEARRYGFRVLIIDGRLDVDQVTSRVERHFGLG